MSVLTHTHSGMQGGTAGSTVAVLLPDLGRILQKCKIKAHAVGRYPYGPRENCILTEELFRVFHMGRILNRDCHSSCLGRPSSVTNGRLMHFWCSYIKYSAVRLSPESAPQFNRNSEQTTRSAGFIISTTTRVSLDNN